MSRNPITTICYNTVRTWESQAQAIGYFAMARYFAEGSEKERYTLIIDQLQAGWTYCSDELTI